MRPGLDAMFKAINAKEFDMVAAWSVDRLALQLPFMELSESMGNHDSKIMGADSVD
jgi:DNA invertase Pin-like site-specific DNA recombinase